MLNLCLRGVGKLNDAARYVVDLPTVALGPEILQTHDRGFQGVLLAAHRPARCSSR